MYSGKNVVYVVDDDESVCRALKVLLTTFDFEVKTFDSAKSFFAAVSNNDPGCLVLDIHMPGEDGWAVQKKILDSGLQRPVIFISADKKDTAHDRALRVGAVGFLQKPFDGQSLVDMIHSALKTDEGVGKAA